MKLNENYLRKVLQAIANSEDGSAKSIATSTGFDRSLVNYYMQCLENDGYIRGPKAFPSDGVGDLEYAGSVPTHKGRAALNDLSGWRFQEEPQPVKYDLRGSKFGGGFAAEGGLQIGGTLNDYSINAQPNEVAALMDSLLRLSENFPKEQFETVQETLEDLMEILQKPEKQTPTRIKRFIGTLLGVAIAVGGAVATATDFAHNTLELSEKLSIPAETFQPQLQQLKQLNPDFDWQS